MFCGATNIWSGTCARCSPLQKWRPRLKMRQEAALDVNMKLVMHSQATVWCGYEIRLTWLLATWIAFYILAENLLLTREICTNTHLHSTQRKANMMCKELTWIWKLFSIQPHAVICLVCAFYMLQTSEWSTKEILQKNFTSYFIVCKSDVLETV